MPGYWAASESSAQIEKCHPPASLRCQGWSAAVEKVVCGVGYDPESRLCQACASGYYTQDGVCHECPEVSTAVSVSVLSLSIVILTVLFLFTCLAIWVHRTIAAHELPTPLKQRLLLAAKVTVWTVLNLQLFVQVAKLSSPGIPQWMRDIFSSMRIIQFDLGGIAPPECDDTNPFLRHNVVLVFGCIFLALSGAQFLPKLRRLCQPGFVKFLLALLVKGVAMIYPLVVNTAFDVLNCVPTASSIDVWQNNSFVTCWDGIHLAPAVGAMFTLAFYGIGAPLMLFWIGRRYAHRAIKFERLLLAEDALAANHLFIHEGFDAQSLPPASRSVYHSAREDSSRPTDPATPRTRLRPPGCRNLCPRWCFLTTRQQVLLLQYSKYGSTFEIGQPWFQPVFLLLFFFLALLDVAVPFASLEARIAKGVCQAISVTIMTILFLLLPVEVNFGLWRRWPRFYVGCVTVLLSVARILVQIDEADATSRSQILDPMNINQRPSFSLSSGTMAFTFITLVLALLAPFITIVMFERWLLKLVGSRMTLFVCRFKRQSGVPADMFWDLMGRKPWEEKHLDDGGIFRPRKKKTEGNHECQNIREDDQGSGKESGGSTGEEEYNLPEEYRQELQDFGTRWSTIKHLSRFDPHKYLEGHSSRREDLEFEAKYDDDQDEPFVSAEKVHIAVEQSLLEQPASVLEEEAGDYGEVRTSASNLSQLTGSEINDAHQQPVGKTTRGAVTTPSDQAHKSKEAAGIAPERAQSDSVIDSLTGSEGSLSQAQQSEAGLPELEEKASTSNESARTTQTDASTVSAAPQEGSADGKSASMDAESTSSEQAGAAGKEGPKVLPFNSALLFRSPTETTTSESPGGERHPSSGGSENWLTVGSTPAEADDQDGIPSTAAPVNTHLNLDGVPPGEHRCAVISYESDNAISSCDDEEEVMTSSATSQQLDTEDSRSVPPQDDASEG